MKKQLLILSVLVICLAALTAETFAFFTGESRAHNVITSGGVRIALLEWADPERTEPFQNVNGAMPTDTYFKVIEVENTGASPAWVRVRIEKSVSLPGDTGKEGDPEQIEMVVNTENWIQDSDGNLYYRRTLPSGKKTEPVCITVRLKPEMDNVFQNAVVSVNVFAHAVQSANNGESAQAAKGWPEAEGGT